MRSPIFYSKHIFSCILLLRSKHILCDDYHTRRAKALKPLNHIGGNYMDILKPKDLKTIKEIEEELDELKFHFKDFNFRHRVTEWLKFLYEYKLKLMSATPEFVKAVKSPEYEKKIENYVFPKWNSFRTKVRHEEIKDIEFQMRKNSKAIDSYTGMQALTTKQNGLVTGYHEVLYDLYNFGDYVWDMTYALTNDLDHLMFDLWDDFLLINNQGEYLAKTWVDNITDRLHDATEEPCIRRLSYDKMYFDSDDSEFVYKDKKGVLRPCEIHCDYTSHNGLIETGKQKIVDTKTSKTIWSSHFSGGFMY